MDLQGLQTLFEITPSNLAEKQYQELIKYVKQVLTDVIKNVEEEKFDYEFAFSPSFGKFGQDNYYIPFYAWVDSDGQPADIKEVFCRLETLKAQIERTKKNEETNERR